jgi:peroxiredoxin Q/BCP
VAVAERGEVNRNAGFDFPLLSDVDGTACEAYGVRRNLAAAPVKRRTVVIGADRVVQDVVRSECGWASTWRVRCARWADSGG